MNIFEDFENEKYNFVQSNIVSTKIIDRSGNVSRSMFYDGSVYQDSIGATLSMDKFTNVQRAHEQDLPDVAKKTLVKSGHGNH